MKRRADAGDACLSTTAHIGALELHMMTSATLIEALYECVDDWLAANTNGKTSIVQLDAEETFKRAPVKNQIS